ncbi:acyltransferase family protein [Auritidibacter ignavus]|uniref:acyltransferase family protein n=1 Tax=Auritidibacter ignavus TaxID=678932 RepID=UPI00109C2E5B|nr:acyltransferase family protein [Auritidibacter ignavus]WHS35105.1 acyltransferase family protein [Auritidibacter ignavus]
MTPPIQQTSVLERGIPERRYLPELHGVRGLALAGVVLFHLFGAGRISGGIDIFLAISGFLFTGMLLREATAKGGRINPWKYFGRLFRRIFVPAALVAAVTLILALMILPATEHRQLWAEARATFLYFENFELINSQLAYGAAGPETSPFQHFWSLSVQGQFYLVWPLIAIIAVLIARLVKTSAPLIMGIISSLILVASLTYAIYVGSYNQAEAYLMSETRAWQLAFGALLALVISSMRLPRWLRPFGGWIGLALIVSCGFFLDGAELFPGPWALWPLLGLMLVLISAGPDGGNNDAKHTATRLLSTRPFGWVADHAYSLYLWHWPLLIFYLQLRDREAIGIRGALFILAATLFLSMLTHRFVERPLQKYGGKSESPRPLRNRPTVLAGVSTLAILGILTTVLPPSRADLERAFGDLDPEVYPGAATIFEDEQPPEADMFPQPQDAREFRAEYHDRNCAQKMGDDPGTDQIRVCEDEEAPESPTATIVLAGGSHAGHLEDAFKTLARKYDWEVLIVLKPSCYFAGPMEQPGDMCVSWNNNFIDWLNENDVDLVVTPGTRHEAAEDREFIADNAEAWWDRIDGTATNLLLVRGTPRAEESVPGCLAEGRSPEECGPSAQGLRQPNPLDAVELPPRTQQIDLTEAVCPAVFDESQSTCDTEVGNILIWFDSIHFTRPFAQSLAPVIEQKMQDVFPHLVRQ